MKKRSFTEGQIVGILREGGRDPEATVAKRMGVSEQSIYTWKNGFGYSGYSSRMTFGG